LGKLAINRVTLSLNLWVGGHLLHGAFECFGAMELDVPAKSRAYEPIEVVTELGWSNT